MFGGSFLDFVPGGGNIYIMQQIIHDWEDELAIKILSKCREAMDSDPRILVVDAVINPGNGRERTAKEFKQLFEKADLQLLKIIPTASMFSIIEGRRR